MACSHRVMSLSPVERSCSKHDFNVPGEGFGGGGGFDTAPIHHLSPDTDPWEVGVKVGNCHVLVYT